MPTEAKVQAVAELADKLRRASMVVLTDYRGLKVADLAGLREQLRGAQTEYKVVKNTLLSRATVQEGLESMQPLLTGPTAVAFCYGDVAAAARILNDFARTSRILAIRDAVLEGKLLGREGVSQLATLPPRERLQADLVGSVVGPLSGFVGVLNAALATMLRVLDARVEQLGGAEQGA